MGVDRPQLVDCLLTGYLLTAFWVLDDYSPNLLHSSDSIPELVTPHLVRFP